jgi:hypothetical protein
MSRPKHPKKEVEGAVAAAEAKGWRWRKQGHWGRLYCPYVCACQVQVNGTPRDAGDHAKDIARRVKRCSGDEKV